MKRFKHLCYYLGSTLFCLMLSCVPLWSFIQGLDGSVSLGKGGDRFLYSEDALTFLEIMGMYLLAFVGGVGAAIHAFCVAWWGTPADRLP